MCAMTLKGFESTLGTYCFAHAMHTLLLSPVVRDCLPVKGLVLEGMSSAGFGLVDPHCLSARAFFTS